MTQVQLLKDLVGFTKEVLQNQRYIDGDGNEKEIEVKAGFLKQKEMRDNAYDHYVLIRVLEGESDHEESTAKVRFIICASDRDTMDGWITVLNILEDIRQAILSRTIICKRYTYKDPVKWVVEEDEAFPAYFATIDVQFVIPNVGLADLEF